MGQLAVILVLVLASACADAVPGDDSPGFDGDAGAAAVEPTLVTDRDPAPLYREAAGAAAPAPVEQPKAGAPAPSNDEPKPEAPVAGSPAPEQPAPGGTGGSGGTGGTGGSAGAPVDPVDPVDPEPTPAPAQPERFCKITTGRFVGQTLGCTDTYSRTSFNFVSLRWNIPSAEAESGFASTGCADYADTAKRCTTGEECRAHDAHTGDTYSGVCL